MVKINILTAFGPVPLTDASLMGKPDIEVVDISKRLENINNIFEVTSKPLIMDIDTAEKLSI